MNDSEFASVLSSIQSKSFDNGKLEVAKQVASTRIFTAAHIREICRLFSFENNRLDFAKYAYAQCFDKNNYFVVNDAFEFSTSTNALNSFIGGRR